MNLLALIHVELMKVHHNPRSDVHSVHLPHRVVHRSVERRPILYFYHVQSDSQKSFSRGFTIKKE